MAAVVKFFVFFAICSFSVNAAPRVKISEGALRGVHLKTYNGRTISAFLGIPYAQPPIGDLRYVLLKANIYTMLRNDIL